MQVNSLTGLNLSDIFKLIDDPRSSRGRLYSLSFLLNCAQSAILSGAKGFRQVGEWIAAQSHDTLKVLGNTYYRKPDESTLRKCFQKIELDPFKSVVYEWSHQNSCKPNSDLKGIAVDGKTLRGSRNSDNRQPHILTAVTHEDGIIIGDKLVPNKKSEIQSMQPFLNKINIKNTIVTADALHTLKDFGVYLKENNSNYVFIAKGNKKKLIERFKMLDIKNNYCDYFETRELSHGRYETRKIYLVSYLPFWFCFKSAEQGFIVERERVNQKTGKKEFESHFGITGLMFHQAKAKEIMTLLRSHWTIENRVFHVRDRSFNEDQSTIRSGNLPELMVALRNLSINLLRLNKVTNISKGLRMCSFNIKKVLGILGL